MIKGEITMTVSKQIIEVLDNLCQKFGIAIDWSSKNILPYLKELGNRFINYEIYTSITWIVVVLVICAILWVIFGATFKGAKNNDWDSEYVVCFINILAGVVGTIASIMAIVTITAQCFDIVEAIHLPEKTIYEYISYQIKLNN